MRRFDELTGQDIILRDAARKTAGGWRSRYRVTELWAGDDLVARLGWRGGGSRSPVPAETAEGRWLIQHARGRRLARVWSIAAADDPSGEAVAELEKPQVGGLTLRSREGLQVDLKDVRVGESPLSMRHRWQLGAEGSPPLAYLDRPTAGAKGGRFIIRVQPAGSAVADLAPMLLLACTGALVAQSEDIFVLPSS